MRARLSRVVLAYADGMALHTARSGQVATLEELRLVLRQGDGTLAGVGASRVNIAYLTGLDPALLVHETTALCRAIDWTAPPAAWVTAADAASAPVRMLVEMAARDCEAREAGVPLCVLLGGVLAATIPTNQTLFWGDEATLRTRTNALLARGFTDLKLRVGIGSIADDLARLALLRTLAGAAATLSVDANGAWTLSQARAFLAGAAGLRLAYCEQPLPPDAEADLARLAGEQPVTLMLDESLGSPEAVAVLARSRSAPLAHLKLAKLGGLDRLMAAGRMLHDAGIGVMVGQMNEGVPSTLAAAHAALALDAQYRELYGADGLAADPAGALRYEAGLLHLPPCPGLGIAHIEDEGETLWQTP